MIRVLETTDHDSDDERPQRPPTPTVALNDNGGARMGWETANEEQGSRQFVSRTLSTFFLHSLKVFTFTNLWLQSKLWQPWLGQPTATMATMAMVAPLSFNGFETCLSHELPWYVFLFYFFFSLLLVLNNDLIRLVLQELQWRTRTNGHHRHQTDEQRIWQGNLKGECAWEGH